MISVVDLGVVKDVAVEGERVRVEFTPTFMGCPALETMRARMEETIRGLGVEPQVDVLLDDSWSTDRITPEGREKLREAGFAPPTPRAAQRRHSCSSSRRRFAAPTAARPRRGSRTSSAPPRAARCAIARAAGSRSSSSRRSSSGVSSTQSFNAHRARRRSRPRGRGASQVFAVLRRRAAGAWRPQNALGSLTCWRIRQ